MIRRMDGWIATAKDRERRQYKVSVWNLPKGPYAPRSRVLPFPQQQQSDRPLCGGGCGRVVSREGAVCLPCARGAA